MCKPSVNTAIKMHTTILKLDTDAKVAAWNEVVRHLLGTVDDMWWGSISWSGLANADVTDRESPSVCVITQSPISDVAELDALRSTEAPMGELMAFVPFSVITNKEYAHTLIVPMGLQKTPGGYGYRRSFMGNVDQKRQAEPVEHVFSRMMTAISNTYNDQIVVMTRFAFKTGLDAVWDSDGLSKLWNRQFPGTLRIGWRAYYAQKRETRPTPAYQRCLDATRAAKGAVNDYRKAAKLDHGSAWWSANKDTDTEYQVLRATVTSAMKTEDDYENEDNELYETGRVGAYKLLESDWPSWGDPPQTYNPRNGGAKYDEKTDTLTVTSSDDVVIFSADSVSTRNMRWLLGKNCVTLIGALVCGWTEPHTTSLLDIARNTRDSPAPALQRLSGGATSVPREISRMGNGPPA